MKAVRIGLLTVLLVGATSRSVPTPDQPSVAVTPTAQDGPCYLLNGLWVCP
jgi:hypothetical protein